ncbi:MAG: type II toxin-antitoxin system VapB family antitoxin [Chitinivibrionales bacterium]
MKTARLFNNGRSQAVRLPKEFRFKGDDVYVKKLDNIVMLFPMEDPWIPLINSLDKFTDDFMAERGQPAIDKRAKIK